MSFLLVTAPTSEPVTLAEAKAHLYRGDVDDDDARISRLITRSRAHIEKKTETAFLTQTWRTKVDGFWGGCALQIQRPPLQSVSSIAYLDSDGVSQTLSSSVYTVDTDSRPGRIYLAKDQTWPTTYGVRHAVTITTVHGASTVAALDPDVVSATLTLLEFYYVEGDNAELPPALRSLVAGLKIPWAA